MKALTILQPWASLIACGAKQIETRSWATKYRGEIAIHAGKNEQFISAVRNEPFASALSHIYNPSKMAMGFDCGKVIAIADLVACSRVIGKSTYWSGPLGLIRVTLENGRIITGTEREFGDYAYGRYAWILDNVQQIKPITAKGSQGIWDWEGQV